MAWRVEISKTAESQITKLDHQVQARIGKFLRTRLLTLQDPRKLGKGLRGEKRQLWRYRAGDYRFICDIRDQEKTIVVLAIGHRKEVYR